MILGIIQWNPSKEVFSFPLPFLGRGVLWYGVLFSLGCLIAYLLFEYLTKEYFEQKLQIKDQGEIKKFVEKCSVYLLTGTVVGARLGEIIFYQDFVAYIKAPWDIFKVWEGGLASHGAALGILAALFLFFRKLKFRYFNLQFFALLDRLVIVAPIAGGCIRIGNLINQEILGKETSVPWAFLFMNPIDHSPIVPRHPVQLYEALFYFILGNVLFFICRKNLLDKVGKMSGLFFIALFSFRFFVEFFKEENSIWSSFLTMGQWLSIPFVVIGAFLIYRSEKALFPVDGIESKKG